MFRTYFGPSKMAFDRLDPEQHAALRSDLVELWTGANIAGDAEHHTTVQNQYLEVRAQKRLDGRV